MLRFIPKRLKFNSPIKTLKIGFNTKATTKTHIASLEPVLAQIKQNQIFMSLLNFEDC